MKWTMAQRTAALLAASALLQPRAAQAFASAIMASCVEVAGFGLLSLHRVFVAQGGAEAKLANGELESEGSEFYGR